MGRTAVRDLFMGNRMDCSCAARAISLACQTTANKLCMDGDLPWARGNRRGRHWL